MDVFFPCIGGVRPPMLDGITEKLGKLWATLEDSVALPVVLWVDVSHDRDS